MLRSLELIHFRSYDNALFEFGDGVNIIVGPNASGKTNLLEAVYLLARGKSFKADDESLVQNNQDWCRINAVFKDFERSIKITKTPQTEKKFVVDGVEKKQLSTQQSLPAVLFEPSHMLMLGGEPERRRTYLDGMLAQLDNTYKNALQAYKRALQQRNKLLKQEQIVQEHLFVWDIQLSGLAGRIVAARTKFIDEINTKLTHAYQHVSGNDEELHIDYASKLSKGEYESEMLKKLRSEFVLDRARGFTGTGPHRDDFTVFLNGNDASTHASRGETRSCVLALKMIELEFIENALDKKPLLLLDDVFSELDGKRRRMLAQTLQPYQTFITTTDADVVIEHFSKIARIIPL